MLTLNFSPFPTLTTERLILRQMDTTDIPLLYEMRSNPVVMQYIGRPIAKSIEDAEILYNTINDGLLKNESINWTVQYKDNKAMLGNFCYWRIDTHNHRAEVGYSLLQQHFGKKIGTEALNAVIHYGFNQLNLHSIEANTDPNNIASQKILESQGFENEANFKENFYFNGQFLDSKIYSLLQKNWKHK